jgi:catechol 2,3-dioxygenase
MSLANISLNVNSVEKSVRFYRDILGFRLIGRSSFDNAFLTTSDSISSNPLLHLSRIDTGNSAIRVERTMRQAGLYHFAILLPSRGDLASIFKHLTENSDQLYFEGTADHLVSESIYLRDPDLNGVEIYRDRDKSEWKRKGQFQVEMRTDHLDLKRLLIETQDQPEWHMPTGTILGHIHLHISNFVRSSNFYSKILGLHHTCSYPGANFFAAGSYHHHIAINTWLGNDIDKADQKRPGLDHFSLNLGSKNNFNELLYHMSQLKIDNLMDNCSKINKRSALILDPDNIKIQIYY